MTDISGNTGRRLDRYVPDYVVFDLETTGISPGTDAVIEVSAIRVRQGNIIGEFSSLVNPERHIPYGATRINGITDDMVADAPSCGQVLGEFLEFIEDTPLAGHNIHSFDMKFLYRDSLRFTGTVPGNDYIDTLYMARRALPALRHHRLTDLAEYYGLSTLGAHRALADCRMNQAVLERLAREPALVRTPEEGGSGFRETGKICPKCGERMWKRKGRYGEFWGCGGYPACRYTENI